MTSGNRLRIIVLTVVAMVLPLPAVPAWAQSAEAEQLFREGRKLLKKGKVEAACEKFEASQELEKSVGTLLNLGECREKLGRFASAWASFRAAEALAARSGKDEKREAEARRRAADLEDRLSYLEIEVGADTRVDGLTITRGGEPVARASWNTDVPVDPGRYVIVARAPGHLPWELEIEIKRRDRGRVVVVPPLHPAPPGDDAELAPMPTADAVDGPGVGVVVTGSRPERVTTTRKLSIAVGLAGVAALGGGFGFGFRANELERRADVRCPSRACDDPIALDLNDRAQDAAFRANVFYAAGGVAVLAAVVMWVAGAPESRGVAVQASAGPGELGLALSGTY